MKQFAINITKDGKTFDTLLSRFVTAAVANYAEPERRGVNCGAGEKVGFSEPKHTATLLCLYGFKPREIAAYAGVGYDVLGVWKYQPDFKAAVKTHCRNFAMLFVKRVLERIEINAVAFDTWLNNPDTGNPVFLDYDEFADIEHYSSQLLAAISAMIDLEWKRLDPSTKVSFSIQMLGCPFTPVNRIDEFKSLLKGLKNSMIDAGIKLLKYPSKENLRLCEFILQTLKDEDND